MLAWTLRFPWNSLWYLRKRVTSSDWQSKDWLLKEERKDRKEGRSGKSVEE